MKILLVITKGEIGGAQSFILALAQGLKNEGHEVVVAFGEGDFLAEKLAPVEIKTVRLNSLKRSRNPLQILSFIKELKGLIKRESFDIIHLNSSNTLPGALAAKLYRPKPQVIFTVHGLSVLDENYKSSPLIKLGFKAFFKFFLKFTDKVVFVSEHNLNTAKKLGIAKKGALIYNGLDFPADYFKNAEEARQFISDRLGEDLSQAYIIGSIGRLAFQKNYEFLISSFSEILKREPNVKGIIVGEGPEREKYETLIKEKGLERQFFLMGSVPEASRLVKAFDIFVLPSLYEGLSISLIEALKSGVPTIASDVGGNSEVVGEENCFEVNNLDDFLQLLFRDRPALVILDRFSVAEMVEKYLEVYKNIEI